MRALFNGSLKNVAGKFRTERRWTPVEVPEGIQQVNAMLVTYISYLTPIQEFVQFDCASPKDETEKRFQFFTSQVRYFTLP